MQKKDSWLLPEGIDEALPEQAKQLERLRRILLDAFACWGYQLVIPPLVDFLDSLLVAGGADLEHQTFKLTDQLSGKLLGVRADMTPLVARMDAHHLPHPRPARLCYYGTVLHTLGDPLEKTRAPMQIGAELYGHAGLDSDFEIIGLMLETLSLSGVENAYLDLGHVAVYRALVNMAGLNPAQEAELFTLLQRKARADLNQFLAEQPLEAGKADWFRALPELNGGLETLDRAGALYAGLNNPDIDRALNDLQTLAGKLRRAYPNLPLSFDLAELRGYHYHTGVAFAAFIPEIGREIARGGRYDNIGRAFGRARPATGFSADLKVLVNLFQAAAPDAQKEIIFAPSGGDPGLHEAVRDLRAQGRTVIQHLPEQIGDAAALGCNAILAWRDQQWVVAALAV